MCSTLLSRTNLTKRARPKTPSPTLNLIIINIKLQELLKVVNWGETIKAKRENISRVKSREISLFLIFLNVHNKIPAQINPKAG